MHDADAWPEIPLTEGIWQIETETSTYIYDVPRALLARLPGGAGSLDGTPLDRHDLRRDGDNIQVVKAPAPVVGHLWEMHLDLRGDGRVTMRRTTIVCHIVRLA